MWYGMKHTLPYFNIRPFICMGKERSIQTGLGSHWQQKYTFIRTADAFFDFCEQTPHRKCPKWSAGNWTQDQLGYEVRVPTQAKLNVFNFQVLGHFASPVRAAPRDTKCSSLTLIFFRRIPLTYWALNPKNKAELILPSINN